RSRKSSGESGYANNGWCLHDDRLVLGVAIFAPWNVGTGMLLFLTLGHCLLGFFDDFVKAVKKRNLGLTAKQKLLGQFILAAI
ncbi:Phospho-N-acetylmuramoyl-pentapeptide-transferase, partial [human gut metagenome]